MATITRQEIIEALERLGQLAEERGTKIELVLVGGALMALRYEARESTRDVDAIVLAPSEVGAARELARTVADERGWPEDWLNDGAKGFLVGLSVGPVVFSAPGIEVRSPATAQLLAMKLSACATTWTSLMRAACSKRCPAAALRPGRPLNRIWFRAMG